MIRIWLLVLCLSGAATAQEWPTIQRVTNLPTGDVLNVRAAPLGGSEIIGALSQDALVELVRLSPNGKWGLVNVGERSGWVALRYLTFHQRVAWPPYQFSCFGTEPFWSVDTVTHPDGLKAHVSLADGPKLEATFVYLESANTLGRGSLAGAGIAATFRAEECSDGMSDRAYGISVDLILNGDAPVHLSGCCTGK